MTQALATILFFIVFIELFIALGLYIGKALYDFVKKKDKPPSSSS